MNNAVLKKNARKHRDIKLVTTEKRRDYLVSEPNYHATKFFSENLSARGKKEKLKYTRKDWKVKGMMFLLKK